MTHIKVTATSQPMLYYVTLMCTVVCIQAGMGRGGGGSIDRLQSSSLSICVCLSDLFSETASDNPLSPPLTSPVITPTDRPSLLSHSRCQITHGSVRLVLWPPNFRESDHALSNYWYRYLSNPQVSVSEYRSHPNHKTSLQYIYQEKLI